MPPDYPGLRDSLGLVLVSAAPYERKALRKLPGAVVSSRAVPVYHVDNNQAA